MQLWGSRALRDGGVPVSLGSQDIMRLGTAGEKHGFKVKGFHLANSQLDRLMQELETALSNHMIMLLPDKYSIDTAMYRDFPNIYATAVKFEQVETGKTFTVHRRGRIVSSESDWGFILDFLETAFEEFHLN